MWCPRGDEGSDPASGKGTAHGTTVRWASNTLEWRPWRRLQRKDGDIRKGWGTSGKDGGHQGRMGDIRKGWGTSRKAGETPGKAGGHQQRLGDTRKKWGTSGKDEGHQERLEGHQEKMEHPSALDLRKAHSQDRGFLSFALCVTSLPYPMALRVHELRERAWLNA